ncbi:replication restart helicase PriA [Calycomorphotria hydatis]|uniref:Replication restart protein PriA n=1 Tax=Calycomorphotria hydatis TaxID=2528027 RepID=A0A517T3C5_9PLAN|nr:primosomal protein N' [Calycomorphotria hydatis]QDT62884.1 Primosomal protein N' [Calycomorphotria hydatis]
MPEETQIGLFDEETPLPGPLPWEQAAALDLLIAEVAINRPLSTTYSYLVPDPLREVVQPGQRVRVPFGRGNRTETGFLVGLKSPTEADHLQGNAAKIAKLKYLDSILDEEPLVDTHMLRLTRWIADYYLCGWGQVLHSVIPGGVKRGAGTKLETFYRATDEGREAVETLSLSKKQRVVMQILLAHEEPLRSDEILKQAECGMGPVQTLKRKGFVKSLKLRSDVLDLGETTEKLIEDFNPTDEQAAALEEILKSIRSQQHETILLHGVTGSGKTEVYIQAIREVVSYGRQAIVLVPEISLTPQTIRRFRARFRSVAVLHSHLSDAERHAHWKQIQRGEVEVVVGARSAVFAPTPHLGLIVIDEEHESTFKQETVPRYHAREVAEERSRLAGVPLILGSATPTLESWRNAQTGRYRLVSMLHRVGHLPLPPVVVVDVRNDPLIRKGQAIGRALGSAIRMALDEEGGQVILFLNVRGYHPAVWCPSCGESLRCTDCDITMTWHKDRKKAICHSCGMETDLPKTCPNCSKPGWRYIGTGTQRLEEEVRAKFPGVPLARMDSDAMKKPGSHDEVLSAFHDGKLRILLGTQMIAKGLDFPNVTLVGVIDADTLLHQPDPRSSERTFQLIAQVAGRTGRSARGGRVYVQSSMPADPAIRFASEHDYLGFVVDEMRDREVMRVPPFRCLARIIFRGEEERVVRETARAIAQKLNSFSKDNEIGVSILGPAPCPIAKLKAHYRYHLHLSAETHAQLTKLWELAANQLGPTPGVEFVLDVDPVNMR